MASVAYPRIHLVVPRSARPRVLVAALLAGALLTPLLAPAPAEAQQTLCLRMGAMIQCDTPAPPSSSSGNLNLGDFSDVILRNRELDIRARESAARTELLRQQTELLRRQNEQLRRQQEQPPAQAPSTGLPQRVQGCPGRAIGKAHYDAQGNFEYRECETETAAPPTLPATTAQRQCAVEPLSTTKENGISMFSGKWVCRP